MTWRCYNCGTANSVDSDYCKSCDMLREDSEFNEMQYNVHTPGLFS